MGENKFCLNLLYIFIMMVVLGCGNREQVSVAQADEVTEMTGDNEKIGRSGISICVLKRVCESFSVNKDKLKKEYILC